MGNVWSYYTGDSDAFDKAACLPAGDACTSFYTLFRRSAAKVVLQQEASGFTSAREQVLLTLENWISEASVLYDQQSEFPVRVTMQEELLFEAGDASRHTPLKDHEGGVPASLEENILKGLCSNPLSTPDSIFKIMVQLGKSLRGDEFLRVVGKYPRAARMFASQQLVARSDVCNSYNMSVLKGDYSQAAAVVGKAAYGDSVLETKRSRLKEASKLLQASMDTSSLSITSTLSLSATELHKLSTSRSADSFDQVMTNEMLELIETQRSMERTLSLPAGLLVGSSLVETVQKLVTLHPVHRQALVLAVDCAETYCIPPRQFWWTLLRVLARTNQWETLLALAGAIRPPIGYVPIIEVMLDEDKQNLARILLDAIQDLDEREQVAALLAEDQENDQDPRQLDTL